jgi:hypothetical protein
MAFITSPNMSLIIPNVSQEFGPAYAQDINSSLGTLDSHNHSPGNGVQITPAGLNINTDLTFLSNNATRLRSARFTLYPNIGAFGATASDVACLLAVGVDLYYIDGSGNQIQITKSGFVNSGAGSISGLSGFPNASASYNGGTGTFVWDQGISQAANMDAATLIIRYPGSYPTPAGNYIALQAPTTLATGYALTFPNTLPGVNNSWMVSTTAGSESWIAADNSTLTVSSNQLIVAPAGITTTQIASATILGSNIAASTITDTNIASATITVDKLAAMTVGQSVGVNGFARSPSCGTYNQSTSGPSDVTNLNITITTSGRPLWLGIVMDSSGNSGIDFTVTTTGSGSGTIYFVETSPSSTTVGAYSYVAQPTAIATATYPGCPLFTILPLAAGTYSFKVQASISAIVSNMLIQNMQLIAYEL